MDLDAKEAAWPLVLSVALLSCIILHIDEAVRSFMSSAQVNLQCTCGLKS